MKQWAALMVVALVVLCALADLIREFYANDTLNYFASKPDRLLYVAVIAVGGGLLVLVFSRLSRQAQRRVQLFGWGVSASLLTIFCGYSLYQTISLPAVIFANSGGAWLLLVPILLAAIAAYLWHNFFRAWKTRFTDRPTLTQRPLD